MGGCNSYFDCEENQLSIDAPEDVKIKVAYENDLESQYTKMISNITIINPLIKVKNFLTFVE